MEDVKRFEIGQRADGNPLSIERMEGFVLHSCVWFGLCVADDGQAGYELTDSFHSFPPLTLPYVKTDLLNNIAGMACFSNHEERVFL